MSVPKFIRSESVDSVTVAEKHDGVLRSPLECGSACMSDTNCSAFSYSMTTRQCLIYRSCARVSQLAQSGDKHNYHYVRSGADNLALIAMIHCSVCPVVQPTKSSHKFFNICGQETVS